MNTSGEVADLMVKEGLQITKEAMKLKSCTRKLLESCKTYDNMHIVSLEMLFTTYKKEYIRNSCGRL